MKPGWSNRLNWWVADSVVSCTGLRRAGWSHFLRSEEPAAAAPEEFYDYTLLILVGWIVVMPVMTVATLLVEGGIHWLSGQLATHEQGLALVFVEVFCAVGVLDATWRFAFAQAARRRYRRSAGEVDRYTRRLLTAARLNDGTPLLQLLVATLATWRFW
jgi:hypothetical protein